MRYHPVLSILLFTLGMNACNSGLPSPAPSPSATPHPTPISFQIAASATPSFHFDTTYQETALSCTTYIETTWGSGPGQWGYPTQLGWSHDMVPPPAFNTQSELYVSDFSNHRLLKYDGHNSLPVQTIPLPEHYFYNPMSFLSRPWAAIAIAKDHIFIPYSSNRIGILSMDGKEEKDIELPYSYSLVASPWRLILVDARGGLIVNGEKHAYFDIGWEEGQWREISSSPAPQVGLFTWDNFVGFEGLAGALILLYKIDLSTDFFNDLSQEEIVLPFPGLILGADQNGWVYVENSFQSRPAYARYSIPNGTKQFGVIYDDLPAEIIRSGVAPDGTLYLIVYDREDVTMQPRIVKCRFP